MKSSLKRSLMALGVAGLFLAVGVLAAGVMNSSSASASPSTYSLPTSPSLPSAGTWSNPVNVSNSGWYDQSPWIAASSANGAVSIGWEQRDQNGRSFLSIRQNSNTTLNGAFLGSQELERTRTYDPDRTVRMAHDGQGRRHMAWWAPDGTDICGRYARIDTDGVARGMQVLPDSCANINSARRKNVAIAASPDGTVHITLGKTNPPPNDMRYWQLSPSGDWTVIGQLLPNKGASADTPKQSTLAVTTNGTVMAAWVDTDYRNDVFYSTRPASPAGAAWSALGTAISANVCAGNGSIDAHTPYLARDESGGLRITWSMKRCDPYIAPGIDEVWYNEWTPTGGWASNNTPLRVTTNDGRSERPAVAADGAGMSHLVWHDDTRGMQELYYAYGTRASGMTKYRRDSGSPEGVVYPNADYYQKEPAIDIAAGYLHVAFGGNYGGDSQKDNAYANIPVAAATPCVAGSYSDVAPNNVYAPYITDLSTANPPIMSGYSDCTFRPNDNISRGQTAKIVIIASVRATNTQGAPHFTDVASGNVFYDFIETAFNAGIISGYDCGGPGELCDPQRRPYFRPNANVTRGQFSKMVALAFNLRTSAATQHFTDVPASSPFYVQVETLYSYGLISGYDCGGTGEPCDSQRRPYFRPNGDITRGQSAKIVSLARHLPR